MGLDELPTELLEAILLFSTPWELCSLELTCKVLATLLKTHADLLWKPYADAVCHTSHSRCGKSCFMPKFARMVYVLPAIPSAFPHHFLQNCFPPEKVYRSIESALLAHSSGHIALAPGIHRVVVNPLEIPAGVVIVGVGHPCSANTRCHPACTVRGEMCADIPARPTGEYTWVLSADENLSSMSDAEDDDNGLGLAFAYAGTSDDDDSRAGEGGDIAASENATCSDVQDDCSAAEEPFGYTCGYNGEESDDEPNTTLYEEHLCFNATDVMEGDPDASADNLSTTGARLIASTSTSENCGRPPPAVCLPPILNPLEVLQQHRIFIQQVLHDVDTLSLPSSVRSSSSSSTSSSPDWAASNTAPEPSYAVQHGSFRWLEASQYAPNRNSTTSPSSTISSSISEGSTLHCDDDEDIVPTSSICLSPKPSIRRNLFPNPLSMNLLPSDAGDDDENDLQVECRRDDDDHHHVGTDGEQLSSPCTLQLFPEHISATASSSSSSSSCGPTSSPDGHTICEEWLESIGEATMSSHSSHSASSSDHMVASSSLTGIQDYNMSSFTTSSPHYSLPTDTHLASQFAPPHLLMTPQTSSPVLSTNSSIPPMPRPAIVAGTSLLDATPHLVSRGYLETPVKMAKSFRTDHEIGPYLYGVESERVLPHLLVTHVIGAGELSGVHVTTALKVEGTTVVRGCTVTSGIQANGGSVQIVGCSISSSYGFGVFVRAGTATIAQCKIWRCYDSSICIHSDCAGSCIMGNEIVGGLFVGIEVNSCEVGDIVIDSNDVYDHQESCIVLRDKASATITRNRLHHCAGNGVYFHQGAKGLLQCNDVYANDFPNVFVFANARPQVVANVIRDGRDTGITVAAHGGGYFAHNFVHGHDSSNVVIRKGACPTVEHNCISGSKWNGIFIDEGGRGLVIHNDVYHNECPNIAIGKDADPYIAYNSIRGGRHIGIAVEPGGGGTIVRNRVYGHESSNVVIGSGADPLLSSNDLYGSKGNGVNIDDGGFGRILNNSIHGNEYPNVFIGKGASPVVIGNSIRDGGNKGLVVDYGGRGRILMNTISNHRLSNVVVRRGADPVIVDNEVSYGRSHGIAVELGGLGIISHNKVFGNALDDATVYVGQLVQACQTIMRTSVTGRWQQCTSLLHWVSTPARSPGRISPSSSFARLCTVTTPQNPNNSTKNTTTTTTTATSECPTMSPVCCSCDDGLTSSPPWSSHSSSAATPPSPPSPLVLSSDIMPSLPHNVSPPVGFGLCWWAFTPQQRGAFWRD